MNENIFCFQVSMINIFLVKVLTSVDKLNNERNGLFLGEGSFLFENVFQISEIKKKDYPPEQYYRKK